MNTSEYFELAPGEMLDLRLHDAIEVLLENYLLQVTKLGRSASFLTSALASSQDLVALSLDSIRNKQLQLSIRINVLVCSCTMISTVGAVFGMNLMSGFEDVPGVFWPTLGVATATGCMLAMGFLSALKPDRQQIINNHSQYLQLEQLIALMPDIQAILVSQKSDLSNQELKEHLNELSDHQVSDEVVQLFFQLYDVQADGKLNVNEYQTAVRCSKRWLESFRPLEKTKK